MHFIFERSASITGHKEMPYTTEVHFIPGIPAYMINNESCRDREEWTDEAIDMLNAMGIKNWGYSFPDIKDNIPSVKFHFSKLRDMLQFEVMALGNSKKKFTRNVFSRNTAQSAHKIDLMLAFIQAMNIDADIHQISELQVTITTYRRYDDLAIYQRLIQGGFNVGRIPVESPYIRAENPAKQIAALFLPRLGGPKKG